MLTNLEIRDFQSLRSLTLELGNLTVVTGPSSSGKTAVIRAMRLLAFNARGTSYITHGAKFCSVGVGIAEGTEGCAVLIERGPRGKDAYRIAPFAGDVTTFTKLATKVPVEVAALLKLSDLNFAGQFDRPYLLTDSAGEVARKLGELTNVTRVFGAARLANTRKLRLNAQLTDARADLDRLTEKAQTFLHLKDRQRAVREAAAALREAQAAEGKAQAIRALVSRHEQAQAVLAQPLPELPDVTTLAGLIARRERVIQLVATYEQAVLHASQAGGQAALADREEEANGQRLQDALEAAGICPTCGQAIHKEGKH